MNILGLLFLIITQFATGRGILACFGVKQRPLVLVALSTIIGVTVFSLLPMIIQFFYIPINLQNIVISILVTTLAFTLPFLKRYDYSIFRNVKFTTPKIYEVLFIAFFIIIMIPSVWHCYYYPPQARDVLSGPEALAEYAVREGTLNNSVFTVNLEESVPNLLKPPFVTGLQIVYKLLVYNFGQVWLSMIAISFLIWVYTLLREKLHAVPAGLVMLFFITIPEMYAYTFILLWDYSNAVFFFMGFYFLLQYFETSKYSTFAFACLMFGFATYIRLDTLMFLALLAPMVLFNLWKMKVTIPKMALSMFLFLVVPFFFYYIWVNGFVKNYLPINLDSDQGLNLNAEIGYGEWLKLQNNYLVFGGINVGLYAYYIYFFLLVLIADAIFFRKFNKEARYMLFGIVIIYFGMPLMTYATAWFNMTTAKRGLFKMFPLMLMYMRNSAMLTYITQAIKNFEASELKSPKPTPVVQQAAPTKSNKKKKSK